MIRDIQEFFDTDLKEAKIDKENRIFYNVAIMGTSKSANGYIYTNEAMNKISQLSNGVKVFLNHPTKNEIRERGGVRDIKDLVGVISDGKYQNGKVFGNLKTTSKAFPLFEDIVNLNSPGVGFSINARVKMRQDEKTGMESVIDVEFLKSVDLVSHAACTSNLYEAFEKNDAWTLEAEKLLDEILKERNKKGTITDVDSFIRSMRG